MRRLSREHRDSQSPEGSKAGAPRGASVADAAADVAAYLVGQLNAAAAAADADVDDDPGRRFRVPPRPDPAAARAIEAADGLREASSAAPGGTRSAEDAESAFAAAFFAFDALVSGSSVSAPRRGAGAPPAGPRCRRRGVDVGAAPRPAAALPDRAAINASLAALFEAERDLEDAPRCAAVPDAAAVAEDVGVAPRGRVGVRGRGRGRGGRGGAAAAVVEAAAASRGGRGRGGRGGAAAAVVEAAAAPRGGRGRGGRGGAAAVVGEVAAAPRGRARGGRAAAVAGVAAPSRVVVPGAAGAEDAAPPTPPRPAGPPPSVAAASRAEAHAQANTTADLVRASAGQCAQRLGNTGALDDDVRAALRRTLAFAGLAKGHMLADPVFFPRMTDFSEFRRQVHDARRGACGVGCAACGMVIVPAAPARFDTETLMTRTGFGIPPGLEIAAGGERGVTTRGVTLVLLKPLVRSQKFFLCERCHQLAGKRVGAIKEVEDFNTTRDRYTAPKPLPPMPAAWLLDLGSLGALPALSIAEKTALARVRVYGHVVGVGGLSADGIRTVGLHGHCVAYRCDAVDEADVTLPRADIETLLRVHFCGRHFEWQHRPLQLLKGDGAPLCVRPAVLKQWLQHLQRTHPQYAPGAGVRIDLSEERMLAVVASRDRVLDEAECAEGPATCAMMGRSGGGGDDDEQPTSGFQYFVAEPQGSNRELQLRRIGNLVSEMISAREAQQQQDQQQEDPQQQQQQQPPLAAVPGVLRLAADTDHPINEFNDVESLIAGAFPWLFLLGRIGVGPNGNMGTELRRRLMLWHDHRFDSDPAAAFHIFNMMQRHRQTQNVARASADNIARVNELVGNPEGARALQDALRRTPLTTAGRDARRVLVRAVQFGQLGVPWSTGESARSRTILEAQVRWRGAPAFFITISPSVIDSAMGLRIVAGGDVLARTTRASRAAAVLKSPIFSALHFEVLMDLLLSSLFCVPSDARKTTIGSNKPGIFGHVVSYHMTTEVQKNGLLHAHIALWCDVSAGLIQQLARHGMQEKIDDIFSFVDSVCKTVMPATFWEKTTQWMTREAPKHPGLENASPEDENAYFECVFLCNTHFHHFPQCWKRLRDGEGNVIPHRFFCRHCIPATPWDGPTSFLQLRCVAAAGAAPARIDVVRNPSRDTILCTHAFRCDCVVRLPWRSAAPNIVKQHQPAGDDCIIGTHTQEILRTIWGNTQTTFIGSHRAFKGVILYLAKYATNFSGNIAATVQAALAANDKMRMRGGTTARTPWLYVIGALSASKVVPATLAAYGLIGGKGYQSPDNTHFIFGHHALNRRQMTRAAKMDARSAPSTADASAATTVLRELELPDDSASDVEEPSSSSDDDGDGDEQQRRERKDAAPPRVRSGDAEGAVIRVGEKAYVATQRDLYVARPKELSSMSFLAFCLLFAVEPLKKKKKTPSRAAAAVAPVVVEDEPEDDDGDGDDDNRDDDGGGEKSGGGLLRRYSFPPGFFLASEIRLRLLQKIPVPVLSGPPPPTGRGTMQWAFFWSNVVALPWRTAEDQWGNAASFEERWLCPALRGEMGADDDSRIIAHGLAMYIVSCSESLASDPAASQILHAYRTSHATRATHNPKTGEMRADPPVGGGTFLPGVLGSAPSTREGNGGGDNAAVMELFDQLIGFNDAWRRDAQVHRHVDVLEKILRDGGASPPAVRARDRLVQPDGIEARAKELGKLSGLSCVGFAVDGVPRLGIDDPLPVGPLHPDPLAGLTGEQRAIVGDIVAAVNDRNRPQQFLVHGPPGTGKTHLIGAIVADICRRANCDSAVRCVSPTGFGAEGLPPGSGTIHRTFDIRVADTNTLRTSETSTKGDDGFILHFDGLRVLVIDEISMVPADMLCRISTRLQRVAVLLKKVGSEAQHPFGGFVVVAFGDFRQLPPICSRGLLHDSLVLPRRHSNLGAVGAQLWREFALRTLTMQMRALEPQQQGRVSELHGGKLSASLLRSIRELTTAADISEFFVEHRGVFVTQTNRMRIQVNLSMLRWFARRNGVPVVMWVNEIMGRHSGIDTHDARTLARNAPELLGVFVQGAPAMLLSNLNSAIGLSNGSPATYVALSCASDEDSALIRAAGLGETVVLKKPPVAVFISIATLETHASSSCVQRIDEHSPLCVPLVPVDEDVTVGSDSVRYRAFPVTAAFAITGHKAQGKTMPRVVAILEETHGGKSQLPYEMLLVLLTRVRESTHLARLPQTSVAELECLLERIERLRPSAAVSLWFGGRFDADGRRQYEDRGATLREMELHRSGQATKHPRFAPTPKKSSTASAAPTATPPAPAATVTTPGATDRKKKKSRPEPCATTPRQRGKLHTAAAATAPPPPDFGGIVPPLMNLVVLPHIAVDLAAPANPSSVEADIMTDGVVLSAAAVDLVLWLFVSRDGGANCEGRIIGPSVMAALLAGPPLSELACRVLLHVRRFVFVVQRDGGHFFAAMLDLKDAWRVVVQDSDFCSSNAFVVGVLMPWLMGQFHLLDTPRITGLQTIIGRAPPSADSGAYAVRDAWRMFTSGTWRRPPGEMRLRFRNAWRGAVEMSGPSVVVVPAAVVPAAVVPAAVVPAAASDPLGDVLALWPEEAQRVCGFTGRIAVSPHIVAVLEATTGDDSVTDIAKQGSSINGNIVDMVLWWLVQRSPGTLDGQVVGPTAFELMRLGEIDFGTVRRGKRFIFVMFHSSHFFVVVFDLDCPTRVVLQDSTRRTPSTRKFVEEKVVPWLELTFRPTLRIEVHDDSDAVQQSFGCNECAIHATINAWRELLRGSVRRPPPPKPQGNRQWFLQCWLAVEKVVRELRLEQEPQQPWPTAGNDGWQPYDARWFGEDVEASPPPRPAAAITVAESDPTCFDDVDIAAQPRPHVARAVAEDIDVDTDGADATFDQAAELAAVRREVRTSGLFIRAGCIDQVVWLAWKTSNAPPRAAFITSVMCGLWTGSVDSAVAARLSDRRGIVAVHNHQHHYVATAFDPCNPSEIILADSLDHSPAERYVVDVVAPWLAMRFGCAQPQVRRAPVPQQLPRSNDCAAHAAINVIGWLFGNAAPADARAYFAEMWESSMLHGISADAAGSQLHNASMWGGGS